MATVRPALAPDRSSAVRTAIRAFAADPLIRWFFPDDETYEGDAGAFFGLQFDMRVEGGEVWVTDDGVAVAMWDVPGGSRMGQEWADATWRAGVETFPGTARERLDRLGAVVRPLHPEEAHWYLGILATHPDWQRMGLGRGVLRPALAEADREGFTAALLTETPENVAFYRGLGFTVSAEPEIEDGPHVWIMCREPGAGEAGAADLGRPVRRDLGSH